MKKIIENIRMFLSDSITLYMIQRNLDIVAEALRPVPQSLPLSNPPMPLEPEEVKRLKEMGFSNALACKDYEEKLKQWMLERTKCDDVNEDLRYSRKRAAEAIKLLLLARKELWKETLLIPYDVFEKMMRKFNLVCGTFADYTGDVPFEKIAPIEELLTRIRDFSGKKSITSLCKIEQIGITNKLRYRGIPSELNLFPFMSGGWPCYYDMIGRAYYPLDGGRAYELKFDPKAHLLFICAPANDMRQLQEVQMQLQYKDPFVCAHTKYGILVFTRWGEEANNLIIRKYEELCNKLDHLIV